MAKASRINGQTHHGNARLIAAAFVFAASFTLYFITLAPTVTLVDSGELILAARGWGVAHPPGFPLYLLLAHAASAVPFGNIAVRIHLASAFFAALASAMMTLLVIEVTLTFSSQKNENKPKTSTKKNREKSAKVTDVDLIFNSNPIITIAPAIMAGLLFGVSRTLWAYATIAEVYTLNTLLIVTIFYLVLGWSRDLVMSRANQIVASNRKLYVAALVFGLALGVHHVTVGLMMPALAVLVISTEGIAFFKGKRVLYAILFSIAGMSIYLYLPIAASQSPLMNWGDPQTLERFWQHVSARQYQAFFEFSPSRISEFVELAMREFGSSWMPFALAFSGAGFVHVFRRDRSFFWFLVLIITADVAYCLCYDIAEDKDAYYMPAFISLTIAASFGARWILISLWKTRLQNTLAPSRTAIVLVIIPLIAFVSNFGFNDRSRYFVAHDYVDNILKSVEPKGMLLTADWQVYSPSLYIREIENQRRDAIVINVNQLRRSWYFDYLDQAYPETTGKSRNEINAYLDNLRAWEHSPQLYAKNAALNNRLNSRFYDMILSFVANQIATAPVYVTSEILTTRNNQDAELSKALNETYKLVPKGLVFRVGEKSGPDDYGSPQILLRGLGDGTLKFDDYDVVKKKVLPVYVNMAMNSGMYFASLGNHGRAIEHFKQALAIDPSFDSAKKSLAASQNAIRQQLSK